MRQGRFLRLKPCGSYEQGVRRKIAAPGRQHRPGSLGKRNKIGASCACSGFRARIRLMPAAFSVRRLNAHRFRLQPPDPGFWRSDAVRLGGFRFSRLAETAQINRPDS